MDGISSATLNGKARNVNVNGASYHQNEEAVTTEGIRGAMYPVRVSSMADLEVLKNLGAKQVTDADSISYEMNVRGQMTTFTLSGKDALQEAPDYSYYVLYEKPAFYKTLTVADGKTSFSAASGRVGKAEGVTGSVTLNARHADVEISLSGIEVDAKTVSAVIATIDGTNYALHHVVNIWRGTEIGWDNADISAGGKTITNLRYYLKDGTIRDYPVSIEIPEKEEEQQEEKPEGQPETTPEEQKPERQPEVTPEEDHSSQSGGGSDDSIGSSAADSGSTAGWQRNTTGWWYRNSDGSWPAEQWMLLDGKWYSFDPQGYMRTGWYQDPKDGQTYYFDPESGAMVTGTAVIDGQQYSFNSSVPAPTYEQDMDGKWVWKGTEDLPLGALIK